MHNVIILGSGCAGSTAAIYAGRAGLNPLVVIGHEPGGQLSLTTEVENYPGFPDGINGPDLVAAMQKQAERFGAVYLYGTVAEADLSKRPFRLNIDGDWQECSTLIIASGASARWLGLPNEQKLIGHGVSSCATCDGAFYKGGRLLVIGGGNSGFEEGLFLTRYAKQVDIVEHNPAVKASQILQDQVAHQPNMRVITNHEVVGFKGARRLEAIFVNDRATGETQEWHYDGVFVFIGLSPNNQLVDGKVHTDSGGFVVTDKTLMTSWPGVFAAGDVRAGATKQAASAAGEGATAALVIREYLKHAR